jgi:hypothetical protein
MSSSRNRINIQNALEPDYPQQPKYNKMCPVNQIYKTIPTGSDADYPTEWKRTAVGPASVKHLYSGIPNWYPIQTISRPVGTMYEHDYSQFHKSGAGKGKRISYHYKVYPFTDRHVRETKDYADYILPYPVYKDKFKRPVKRDNNLNSTMQYQPYAYSSDDYKY